MILVKQLRDMIYSFISALTTAIDQRTPYNANHSYNVARYCDEFARYLMREEKERSDFEYITDSEREQLVMAALVHDVGKLITPLEVMNKSDRLDYRLPIMEMRWKYYRTLLKLDLAEKRIGNEEYLDHLQKVEDGIELIKECNTLGVLSEDKLEAIRKLNDLKIVDRADNKLVEFITDDELHEMLVVRGTLTAEERKIIQMHAVYTDRILSEIKFQDDFKLVRQFARAHHELLDGSGYPNGLKGDEIPLEVRIMTIADIYDSLTADDRPYKKAMPVNKAISILKAMAGDGKLDKELVEQFAQYILKG
jgi:HD-GYP domain-containing protein (c-di-GMP phosphodiesterase class II)